MCNLLVIGHNLQGTELVVSLESTVLTHRRSTHARRSRDSQLQHYVPPSPAGPGTD